MALGRADLTAILQAVPFSTIATAIGQGTNDDASGWKATLDQVLADLGVPAGGVILDPQWPLASALTRYRGFEQLAAVSAANDWDISVAGGEISNRLSQRTASLRALADQALADVRAAQTSVSRLAIGTLTQTAPILPTAGQFDPNDRRYRGDPLRWSLFTRSSW